MTTKIKSDYKPSQRVYELLKAYGVQNPVEFVGHELPAFMMYWEETGKAKASWDTTCLNWMKRTYEDKKHQMALNRSPSGSNGDVFGKVLLGIDPASGPDKSVEFIAECSNGKIKYRLPEPPKPGPAMKPEDAFAQLRNSGVIK